jgi:WD40 repeat protein
MRWNSCLFLLVARVAICVLCFSLLLGSAGCTQPAHPRPPLRMRAVLRDHRSVVEDFVFVPNTAALITAGEDQQLIVWNTETGQGMRYISLAKPLGKLAVGRDGKYLASAERRGRVLLWDTGKMSDPIELAASLEPLASLTFSPNGQRLVAAQHDGNVVIWDAIQSDRTERVIDTKTEIDEVAFVGSGNLLAVLYLDGVLQLWDLAHDKPVRHISSPPNSDGYRCVACSRDGSVLALGRGDGGIDFRSSTNLQNVASVSGHHLNVEKLSFNFDGSILASTCASWNPHGAEIIFWNTKTYTMLTKFTAHASTLTSLAFNSEGTIFATASADDTVILWDATVLSQLREEKGNGVK